MRKPLIGITANTLVEGTKESGRRGDISNTLPQSYIEAIEASGGVPVIIPLISLKASIKGILSSLDGILLSGGGDIDPALFGEEPHPALRVVDVAKDRVEIMLIRRALAADRPILGICRGMQILNVAAGGTMIQDIPHCAPSKIRHSQRATAPAPAHSIEIKKGARLEKILGKNKLRVNSYHHQAVGRIAPGFKATATAPDGIVECIESGRHRFVMGVQFHPEMIFRDLPVFKKLFTALVREASRHAS